MQDGYYDLGAESDGTWSRVNLVWVVRNKERWDYTIMDYRERDK